MTHENVFQEKAALNQPWTFEFWTWKKIQILTATGRLSWSIVLRETSSLFFLTKGLHKAGINLFEVKDGKKSMISKNFENHRICKNKWDIFGSSLCFSSQIERCRTLEAHRWETNNLTTKLTPSWILKWKNKNEVTQEIEKFTFFLTFGNT